MATKTLLFFSHDYNVRTDIKIKALIRKWKMEGYGVYWAILEDLYNNANALPTQFDLMAEELNVSVELVESVVKDFNLFKIKGKIFFSPSASKRLKAISEKSTKAKESARSRWDKDDANALRTHIDRNAIKQKEKKPNIIKLNEKEIKAHASDFENQNLEIGKKENSFSRGEIFPIPTKEEVKNYFEINFPGIQDKGMIFYEHFEGKDWLINEKPFRWKNRANKWVLEDQIKQNEKPKNGTSKSKQTSREEAANSGVADSSKDFANQLRKERAQS